MTRDEQRSERMSEKTAAQTRTALVQQAALKYAIALMRGRLQVEAPANVVLIREQIAALESLALGASPPSRPTAVRSLAACAYQALGALGAPERFLDSFSAAAMGQPYSLDGLLPLTDDEIEYPKPEPSLPTAREGLDPHTLRVVQDKWNGSRGISRFAGGLAFQEWLRATLSSQEPPT